VAIPIEESFQVAAPIEQVWSYFQDPPQVVPCIPGAELVGVLGEKAYEGIMKFQLGPVRAQFKGTITIDEIDAQAHLMALTARGIQLGAVGQAEAQVQFTCLSLSEQCTEIGIKANVSIAGKLAQLGGGMIQSVARQLFREFAECAQHEILGDRLVQDA
jgi:carbon monoxide dehydrogenase subunit G